MRDYRTAHFRKVLRPRILEAAGYRCQIRLPGCTLNATVIDHILPRSRGGTNDPWNLRAACSACNQARRRTHPGPSKPTPPENW